jgi:hypothetical protein
LVHLPTNFRAPRISILRSSAEIVRGFSNGLRGTSLALRAVK